jgi:hypothetical protein
MSGPNFDTDVSITKASPALVFVETDETPDHTWRLVAGDATFQLQDVTNSAIRILVDADGRVGIGAEVTELEPHRLTLKDRDTVLSLIHGTEGSPLTGEVIMIDAHPYIATESGNKYRGFALRPVWSGGGGQVDVIALGADYNAPPAVSGITHSGPIATVTTASPHGYDTDDKVWIAGATPSEYNGLFDITRTGDLTFTYVMASTPASNASGTIKQSGPSEVGLFIGDIKSYGSGSSYGGHIDVTTYADPTGAAKERGLLITISRRPGCPVGTPPKSFSRGIEIYSLLFEDNLRAGSGIEIYGPWTNGIMVAPTALYNGFGTVAPNTRLHVAGDGDETIKLETTDGSGSAWSFKVIGSDGSLQVSSGATQVARLAKTSATTDSTTYTETNAVLIAANNLEALGVAGSTTVANINMYLNSAADRKATIQAAVSGGNGGSLSFFVKPHGSAIGVTPLMVLDRTGIILVSHAGADVQVTNGGTTTSVQPGFIGTLTATNLVLMTNNATVMTLFNGGGATIGTPTGGNKGAGTLNATAVYDDGVLLTDWVFEEAYGKGSGPRRGSKRLFTLDETRTVAETEHRLPWMPTRDEFDVERSVGRMVARIWQGQEQQQLYLLDLEARITALVAEVARLKAEPVQR